MVHTQLANGGHSFQLCRVAGNGIISAVKGFEFLIDRMLYTILTGRWCDIIVLNIHAIREDKIEDM
jgi:hypothetical protein